jgi:DNA mismatch endonuclease (patch repair protein)
MSRIRSKGTKPELVLRRELHRIGYRFVTNLKSLPGTPDIVFSKRKKAVLVHGCFWHSHDCKWGSAVPATNVRFWSDKRSATVLRDERKIDELQAMGWKVFTVWECQLRRPEDVMPNVVGFLGAPR